jgi:aminoglycoside phosphotransferase (APT) family kinase protein
MSSTESLSIDEDLICRLVETQFPHWVSLPVHPVSSGGWCNRTFHLGSQMVVRLPRLEAYAVQVTKEQHWLPQLAPVLPLPIPTPLALGKPGCAYPWNWSVYKWIGGEIALPERIANLGEFANALGKFLAALQRVDIEGGPAPGPHSFYRGGSLKTYNAQTRQAIAILDGKIDIGAVTEVWASALGSTWVNAPVWVHGDVSAGNLLVRDGRLSAVIDFGNCTVGDPACDLAMAWTMFEGESRAAFREALALDTDTWARARGWTLWKALIVAAGMTNTNAVEAANPWRVIDEVLADN